MVSPLGPVKPSVDHPAQMIGERASLPSIREECKTCPSPRQEIGELLRAWLQKKSYARSYGNSYHSTFRRRSSGAIPIRSSEEVVFSLGSNSCSRFVCHLTATTVLAFGAKNECVS